MTPLPLSLTYDQVLILKCLADHMVTRMREPEQPLLQCTREQLLEEADRLQAISRILTAALYAQETH